VPEEEYTIPLGKADIKREGRDITIVTYGRMVQMCLEVAEKLAVEGLDAEVIDVRTLVPLDSERILESVMKTRRVAIVHEAVQFSGFGAEIAAQISGSETFFHLEAPIKRVGGYYTPIPFNPILEQSIFPTPARIESAVREVMAQAALIKSAIATRSADAGEPRATLLARRIAAAKGIDLAGVAGSGVSGRIYAADLAKGDDQATGDVQTKGDVPSVQQAAPATGDVPSVQQAAQTKGDVPYVQQAAQTTGQTKGDVPYVQQAAPAQGGAPSAQQGDSLAQEAGGTVIRMNGMRRAIAKRMSQSARETATVSQFVEVDVTELLSMRDQLNALRDKAGHVTVTAFILRAMAIAVREHERFRMQMGADGDSFVLLDDVNIGVAVGTPEGLTVPVLRNAYVKTLETISAETTEMAQKAREGKLSPDAYTGGVITLTNMGMYGVKAFTPIINQPEASILGIGAPTWRLVLEGNDFMNRAFMHQSLTYDHRIINGTESALFQLRLKELLEDPKLLL